MPKNPELKKYIQTYNQMMKWRSGFAKSDTEDSVNELNDETRPYIVGEKIDKGELTDIRSIFPLEMHSFVMESAKRIVPPFQSFFRQTARYRFFFLLNHSDDVTTEKKYVFLAESINYAWEQFLYLLAESPTTVNLLIGFLFSWEIGGAAGMDLAISALLECFISTESGSSGIVGLETKDFQGTFNSASESRRGWIHCPYHSLSVIFVKEFDLLLTSLPIAKIPSSQILRANEACDVVTNQLSITIERAMRKALVPHGFNFEA